MLVDNRVPDRSLFRPHHRDRRAAGRAGQLSRPRGVRHILGLGHEAVEAAERLPQPIPSERDAAVRPSRSTERARRSSSRHRTQRATVAPSAASRRP
jgi:hypothetical protein